MKSARLTNSSHNSKMSEKATVIATFSRRMLVRLSTNIEVDARIKGKKIKAVCGDLVNIEPIIGEKDWLITEIKERRNALTRPNKIGHIEVLAANLDALIIIASVSPLPDWYIVDRYICAAEIMGVQPIIVFNKVDLLERHDIKIDELLEYRKIGFPVIDFSVKTNVGSNKLLSLISEGCSIVVGQSGVGKSSLINKLIYNSDQRVGNISPKSGEGRHTTVNTVMKTLQNGGYLIDSPGVRDYAPALTDSAEAQLGFREIAKASQFCRFSNCKHLREPGCAIKQAVEDNKIDYRRYESYKRVVNLTSKLIEKKY